MITAYFLGDGYWLDGKAAFSTTSNYLARKYSEVIAALGYEVKSYKRKPRNNWKQEIVLVVERKFSSVIKTTTKLLPNLVKNKKYAIFFLKGIFDSEGSISLSSNRRGKEIKIANTDEKIASLVTDSLKSLGIDHTYREIKRKKRKKIHVVKMYRRNTVKFITYVKPFKLYDPMYLDKLKIHPSYRNLIPGLLHTP